MQPNEERPTTIFPQATQTPAPLANSSGVLRADDRTRHHKKLMMIAALGIVTILVVLAVIAWFARQAELKQQALKNEYQMQSFQNSLQQAKSFFAANPPVINAKTVAVSQKSAAAFFAAHPSEPATSAQLQTQVAQFSAMQEQGFETWKASQPQQ